MLQSPEQQTPLEGSVNMLVTIVYLSIYQRLIQNAMKTRVLWYIAYSIVRFCVITRWSKILTKQMMYVHMMNIVVIKDEVEKCMKHRLALAAFENKFHFRKESWAQSAKCFIDFFQFIGSVRHIGHRIWACSYAFRMRVDSSWLVDALFYYL